MNKDPKEVKELAREYCENTSRQKSKCKGPEIQVRLIYSKNSKEVSVVEVKRTWKSSRK